jgi:hypothetical protein
VIDALVEGHYRALGGEPTPERIGFWLAESRTPERLVSLARTYPNEARDQSSARPLLRPPPRSFPGSSPIRHYRQFDLVTEHPAGPLAREAPVDSSASVWDHPTMIVTLDAKRRVSIPVALVPAAPGDQFDASFDAEDDVVILRRLKRKPNWLEVWKQCPVPMDDLPPRSRERPKRLKL